MNHTRQEKSSLDILGKGGMGEVYLDLQSYPQRHVAVKRLLYPTPETQKLLLHEANITGKLTHPNIVPIYEIRNPTEVSIEVHMKYIKGRTLSQFILCDDFTIQKTVKILIKVCKALTHAHNHGIIHRDIKPDNIMIGEHEEVYLLDWGIALDTSNPKSFNQGMVGTPGYMAPEMLSGKEEQISEQTDVYLMGATLHEVLTKEVRHTYNSERHIQEVIASSAKYQYTSEVSEALADLCNRCCAKELEKRPNTITELKEELLLYLEHDRVEQICAKAENEGGLVSYFLKNDNRFEAENSFHRSRLAFEQVLMIIPTHKKAIEGYERVMDCWIEWHIQNQHPEEVEKWFEGATYLTSTTRRTIHKYLQLQKRRKQTLSRWQRIGRSYLQIENKKSHILFVCLILVAVFFLASSLTENYSIDSLFISPHQLLKESSIMMVPILLATIWVHHYHPHNIHLRHLTTCFCGTIFLMLLHRYIAFEYGHEILSIINVDTFIVAFGFWMSQPAFRSGKDVGGLCCLMGIATLFFPSLFWFCNLFCIVCIISGVIIDLIHAIRVKDVDFTATNHTNPL